MAPIVINYALLHLALHSMDNVITKNVIDYALLHLTLYSMNNVITSFVIN